MYGILKLDGRTVHTNDFMAWNMCRNGRLTVSLETNLARRRFVQDSYMRMSENWASTMSHVQTTIYYLFMSNRQTTDMWISSHDGTCFVCLWHVAISFENQQRSIPQVLFHLTSLSAIPLGQYVDSQKFWLDRNSFQVRSIDNHHLYNKQCDKRHFKKKNAHVIIGHMVSYNLQKQPTSCK